MARTRMVTRTIMVNHIGTMVVDITSQQVQNTDYIVTGEPLTKEEALKAVKNLYEDDTHKVVMVNSVEVEEVLMGMTEGEFISFAKVLPPRTTNE